ncbi:hypothetical protein [Ornithinimicrobium kibberense]
MRLVALHSSSIGKHRRWVSQGAITALRATALRGRTPARWLWQGGAPARA